jgi:hypothetical protein
MSLIGLCCYFCVEDLLLIKSFAFGDDEINDGEYE